MGFYNSYKQIFAAVKADLEAVASLKQVVLGEQFKLADLPLAIINAREGTIARGELGTLLEVTLNFDVVLVIRDIEPADWFEDIITVMAAVFDKIVSDSTLTGTVKDVWPVRFTPGEVRFTQKIYYGGLVGFQATMFF